MGELGGCRLQAGSALLDAVFECRLDFGEFAVGLRRSAMGNKQKYRYQQERDNQNAAGKIRHVLPLGLALFIFKGRQQIRLRAGAYTVEENGRKQFSGSFHYSVFPVQRDQVG